MTMKPRIQIFVACHKPTYVLDNRLLVPIQVGKAQKPDMNEWNTIIMGIIFLLKTPSIVS